jgi:hypothetical protein
MVFYLAISTSLWAILGVVTLFIGIRWRRNRSKLLLPPGPKKLPLVGNLFDIPSERQWETYLQWSKEFSALVSLFQSKTDHLSLRFGNHPCGSCGHIHRRLVLHESNQRSLSQAVLPVFR